MPDIMDIDAIFDEAQAEVEAENTKEEAGGSEDQTDDTGITQDDPEVEVKEDLTDGEDVEETEESATEPATSPDKVVQTIPDVEKAFNQRQNQAFASLRTRAEQAEAQLQFYTDYAKKNGLTLAELTERYQQSVLAEEAKQTNIPVEVLQRQREAEAKIALLEQKQAEMLNQEREKQFNTAFDGFVKTTKLDEKTINQFIQDIADNGIDVVSKPSAKALEAVYYMLYPEKQEEMMKQKIMQKQKKDSKSAPLTHSAGNHLNQTTTEKDIDKAVDDFLAGTPYEHLQSKKK